ncbi:MAG: transcription antitermination factor NusB [Zetaproteobacteria bacterium]|nr:transcription antitermination factor NusB [Zetaproteobacteria bacterium]
MKKGKTKTKSPNRHQARESVLEILYAWHSGEGDNAVLPALLADRFQEEGRESQDQDYVREALYGIVDHTEAIDATILKALKGRSLKSIAQIEWNVLRLATWEMQNRLEIPYRVIINEALEITRDYADEAARGFINGVLDKLAKDLRPVEINNKEK